MKKPGAVRVIPSLVVVSTVNIDLFAWSNHLGALVCAEDGIAWYTVSKMINRYLMNKMLNTDDKSNKKIPN